MNTADSDLAWRVEAACMNAWPSPRQLLLHGWLIRASGGAVRRTNSVNPLRGCSGDVRPLLATAESIYAALGQSSIFRVTSLVDGVDDALAAAGYAAEGHTLTLFADLKRPQATGESTAALAHEPDATWLAARARLGGVAPPEQQRFAAMLDTILLPRAFAARCDAGAVASLAYGVLCDGLLVIEAVITDPARRRRGHGRETVAKLLEWGRQEGAEGACLQVVADNVPALALYRSLGFERELSRYHYRRKAFVEG